MVNTWMHEVVQERPWTNIIIKNVTWVDSVNVTLREAMSPEAKLSPNKSGFKTFIILPDDLYHWEKCLIGKFTAGDQNW